jgi:uncharacterized protein involved in exopolysaccharide biosynthesis
VQDAANPNLHARPGSSDAYNTFGQLSIADIFDFVRRYFFLTVLTTGFAIAIAVAHILTAPSLYTSGGLLLIDVRVPQLANEQWREAGMVLDAAQVESQIAIFKSEPVSIAVVKKLNLMSDPFFNPPDPSAAAKPAGEPDAATNADLREVGGRVLGGLSIRRSGFSYVLEISYTSPDPVRAAQLANAFMQAFIDDQISMRAEAARQGTDWLEKRINSLRMQMNEAALKVQEFKARRDYSIVGRSTGGQGASDAAAPSKGHTETLEELEATAMTYRRMFESALQAYTEVDQRQSYAVSSARVIATATPPTGKSFPKRKQALMVAVIAGVAMGFGIGLLLEGYRFARAASARSAA